MGEKIEHLDLQADLMAAPLTGYRAWCLTGGRLKSVGITRGKNRPYWHSSVMTAECLVEGENHRYARGQLSLAIQGRGMCLALKTEEKSPAKECCCGLWAMPTLQAAVIEMRAYAVGRAIVFGEVEMWGQVLQHEYGWRAEHMRIKTLYQDGYDLSGYDLVSLCDYYNCTISPLPL